MPETILQADVIPFAQRRIAQELTIESARDCLDWLEAHGVDQAEVEIDPAGRVAIVLKC
jgi:hypothetical protein